MNRTTLLLIAVFAATAAIALAQPPGGGPGGGGGAGGSSGDGIWRRNAYYGELLTFDSCVGHQPGTGQYHYHANPLCLRAQLNDNVVTLRTSRNGSVYQEASANWHHSPILGWATDGYPIYGPYGYSDPTNSGSALKRIKSGFRLRSITQRHSLPDWALPNHSGVSQTLTSSQYGPDVSSTFPLGRYVEDYEWVSGVGDLDQYNGRFTVTPEYPNGTYAYYATIDDTGTPAFPFIIAGEFYGTVGSGFTTSVTATTTDYFNAGSFSTGAPAIPALTSWSTKYSTTNATIVSGFDPAAGLVTTWPGTNSIGVTTSGSNTSPALADIQRIRYTSSTVYITGNGLAGGQMGPWFAADETAGIFSNFPSSSSSTLQLPRSPAAASSRTSTGMGPQGLWVNGVTVYNFLDGASYTNSSGADSSAGNKPDYVAALYSSASYEQGPIAPGSLVTASPLWFAVLASSTATATSTTWPSSLADITSIKVTDSAGTTGTATIYYASPTQVNFRMPTGLASGVATMTLTNSSQTITSSLNIAKTYPNLFLLNSGALAAGAITRVHNGVTTTEQIYQTSGSSVVAAPVSLNGDTVYLTVYGSGLGTATSATATIGGTAANVTYAGPQGTYSGLDQYNIQIPSSLTGAGNVAVVVTAGGEKSNPVYITIQ